MIIVLFHRWTRAVALKSADTQYPQRSSSGTATRAGGVYFLSFCGFSCAAVPWPFGPFDLLRSPSTRSHDAVGQVPCELVRGSQIGAGWSQQELSRVSLHGGPRFERQKSRKNKEFFEKPRTGSNHRTMVASRPNNLQARAATCAHSVP